MEELLDVYVGFERPPGPHQVDAEYQHALLSEDFAWAILAPRWEGDNTSECVAALIPTHRSSPYPNLERYRRAARTRGEVAVVMSEVGRFADGTPFSPQDAVTTWTPDGIVWEGAALPDGVRLATPGGLDGADRDLALRLKDARGARWFELSANGRNDSVRTTANGTTYPLLRTDVGEMVAFVWMSPDADERWYHLPWGVPWGTIVGWLADVGVQHINPNAWVRCRRAVDARLRTREENEADGLLADLDRDHEARRAVALEAKKEAERNASFVRHPLLHQSGGALIDAVEAVLRDAGLSPERLDDTLGGTKSGDLLCSIEERHWLVEVTSASGSVGEKEVGALERHIDVWPRLRPEVRLEGAVLVVNHDYRLPPAGRPPLPFIRPEFVASLKVRVVGTVPLCVCWASGDTAAIVEAITGPPGQWTGPSTST